MLTTSKAIELLQRNEERKDLAQYARIKMKCIAALKKTVPRQPLNIVSHGEAGFLTGLCGTCGENVNTDDEYCRKCGHRQDWRLT